MDPLDITDKDRLFELLAKRRKGKSRSIDEAEMNTALKRRVLGQDHIISDLCRFIRLQWGKERRGKPIANLLFVGPPATGKTELAKSLAEYLFDDEKNMLRFDCAEFSGPEGKTRLIGAPTGYVGAEKGGQLTRPMFSKAQRLILFDEIEKAYAGVFDLLLSLMDDGRLTEQDSGNTADFTQAVMVMTSNAEYQSIGKLIDQYDDAYELDQAIRALLREAKTFRPELLSRIDRVYAFKPLEGDEVIGRIGAMKIIRAAEEYGVEISYIDAEIVDEIMQFGEAGLDARELARRVADKLGDVFMEARERGWERVVIRADEAGRPTLHPSDNASASDGPPTRGDA